MRELLLLAHYVIGSGVTALMFAFAAEIRCQRREIVSLRRRIAFYQGDARELQQLLRERTQFESECG